MEDEKADENEALLEKADQEPTDGNLMCEESQKSDYSEKSQLKYLLDNSNNLLNDVFASYLHHRKAFTVLLLLEMYFKLSQLTNGFLYHENLANQLHHQYPGLAEPTTAKLVTLGFSFDALIGLFVYAVGFHGLLTHSTRSYQTYQNLLILATGIAGSLSLITAFYLIDIFFKILLYIYARYLLSLLVAALGMERDHNLNQDSEKQSDERAVEEDQVKKSQ